MTCFSTAQGFNPSISSNKYFDSENSTIRKDWLPNHSDAAPKDRSIASIELLTEVSCDQPINLPNKRLKRPSGKNVSCAKSSFDTNDVFVNASLVDNFSVIVD